MPTNIKQTKEDYKSSISEILSISSLAYLLSPFRSKRLLIKIIWFIFILIFLFLSIYYVILNILDYLKYDTTTSLQTVYESEPEFPTISFCLKQKWGTDGSSKKFEIEIGFMWFNNQDLINEWQNHLETYQDLVYGQCYRFNSGLNMSNQSIPFKNLKTIGRDDGLWLDINSKSNPNTTETLIVYIHNHTQMPVTIYNKGKYFSKGLNTHIIIEKIYDKKLESPYNDCLKDVSQYPLNKTIINYLKHKNREYTQKECFYLCRNLKFNEFDYCNCQLPSLDNEIWNDCFNIISESSCYRQFVDSLISNDSCSNYCPLECDSFTYETPIYTELDYDNQYSLIIYFEDFKYSLISQQPKIELFSLISNLGGILGLFIGFSFISLLEIIEVLGELVYIFLE
jgi:hypothetical protein